MTAEPEVVGIQDQPLVIQSRRADDVTLIFRRQDAQRIKDLVEKVRAAHGERYM